MKRANGRGSIYFEKARKKWIVAITERETGKRIVRRFTFKPDAEAYLDRVNTQVYDGTYTPKNNITIGEWLVLYVQTYKKGRVKRSTYKHYATTLGRLEPISSYPLQTETGINVQRFFNNSSLAISTKRSVATFLRSAIRKAVALNLVPRNFMDNVEIEREPQKQREVFTLDELRRIDAAARGYAIEPIYLIAKYTGMRMGEILALTYNDIDLQAGTITVSKDAYDRVIQATPKTSSSYRTISIGGTLINYLASYKELHPRQGTIFLTTRGRVKNNTDVRLAWVECLERAGVRYRPFHCLRHTHASLLLANGVPVAEVAHRLGHSSPVVTYQIYTHFIPREETTASKVELIYCSQVATNNGVHVATKVSDSRSKQ